MGYSKPQRTTPPAVVIAVVMLTLAGFAPGARAQQPVEVITLAEAKERALRHSPTLIQAAGEVRVARAAELTSWGAFLPSLSLSTGAARSSAERFNPQTNTTVTGASDSYSARLIGSVDLFTAGRRGAELRQNQATSEATRMVYLERHQAVVLAAKRAFYGVLRTEDLVRVAESRVERAQQTLALAEQRVGTGAAPRSDVLRAQLELNEARSGWLRSGSDLRNATLILGHVVGAEGAVGTRREDLPEPGIYRLSTLDPELALPDVSIIRAAEAEVRSGQARLRTLRTHYLPSLRLSADSDWFNQTPSLEDGRVSWTFRVGIFYPLLNGFQREESVTRARAQSQAAEARLQDAKREVRVQIERLVDQLAVVEKQIELAKEAVEIAQEDLRIQRDRYQLGASTILDHIASQFAHMQAETTLVAARYDYQLIEAELEALIGRDS